MSIYLLDPEWGEGLQNAAFIRVDRLKYHKETNPLPIYIFTHDRAYDLVGEPFFVDGKNWIEVEEHLKKMEVKQTLEDIQKDYEHIINNLCSVTLLVESDPSNIIVVNNKKVSIQTMEEDFNSFLQLF